jgi:hypothetical protein
MVHKKELKMVEEIGSSTILWIDLEKEDENHRLRDLFIKGTIAAGATSIEKLMAVTYLSQFENQRGEFAERPVFAPDFVMCFIPFSSQLLSVFEDVYHRGLIDSPVGDGQDLCFHQSRHPLSATLSDLMDNLLQDGAQLARLYLANKKNLKRFQRNDRGLFDKVRECYSRDRKLKKKYAEYYAPYLR